MQSDSDVSVDTDDESLAPSSCFIQVLLEWPLCQDCEVLLKDRPIPLPGCSGADNLDVLKSDFDHTTKETAESCSLCFCMWHLLPVDLPQSTVVNLKHYSFAVRATVDEWPIQRKLGNVYYRYEDVAQQCQPAATVDFQEVSRMLRECEEHHNHHTWDLPRYRSPVRIQLIDVEELMIVPANTENRYLALSYVWGEHDSFAATTKTSESLGQKGGLGRQMNKIPQTIKDAMEVVRKLGERYLWVDRLCIEQDNPTQKEVEIQKMDIIYSHALITIIAHAGLSATSPLPGVRPGTRLGLPIKRIGDLVMFVDSPSLWQSRAPHEMRGWTLQEQLLSQRCLYFDYHTTWFQCDNGACREDRPYELLQPPDSHNMKAVQSSAANATTERGLDTVWDLYVDIIEKYRTRTLRYSEDTVYAIQGVAQVISSSLDVPLVSAVPLSLLPFALRFYHDRDSISERLMTAPSWSWAGWRDSTFCEKITTGWRDDVGTLELQMKVEYKGHTPTQSSTQGVSQLTDSELASPTETPNVHAPLYTLLDIECLSTKASDFTTEPIFEPELYGTDYSLFATFYINDQGGTRCGYSCGKVPSLSGDDFHSDNLRWILLSRHQPPEVRLQWASHTASNNPRPRTGCRRKHQDRKEIVYKSSGPQKSPWPMRDIMLIKWSQTWGFWERVCIAHVVENAWEAASSKVTRLSLG